MYCNVLYIPVITILTVYLWVIRAVNSYIYNVIM